MPTQIIQMRAVTSGGTENDVASFDIPDDGRISAVSWGVSVDLDADSEFFAAELSFISTNQLGTNDSRGSIDGVRTQASLTTSGIAVAQINKFVTFDNLQVAGGERVHLHSSATAGVVGSINCWIHLEIGAAVRRARRRR